MVSRGVTMRVEVQPNTSGHTSSIGFLQVMHRIEHTAAAPTLMVEVSQRSSVTRTPGGGRDGELGRHDMKYVLWLAP